MRRSRVRFPSAPPFINPPKVRRSPRPRPKRGFLLFFAPVTRCAAGHIDIDARGDDLDATALHYAATIGDVPMAKLLLARGARFDLKHKYGGTPLRTAIYCAANFRNPHGQYAAVVQLLIDAGEKVTNDRLEFAVANNLDEIATVLKGVRCFALASLLGASL